MNLRKRVSLEDRLWAKINKQGPNDCWLWTAGCAGNGYGTLRKWVDTKWVQTYAHREVLRLSKGNPPLVTTT